MTVPMLPPPPVDLATLLGEMAALKSEVRAETRSARELRERLSSTIAVLSRELEEARSREARLRDELAAMTAAGRDPEIRRLIGLHERIEALARAGRAPRRRWWRRQPDPAARALGDGLALTLERIEEALSELGVRRVPALGAPFDPHRMEAVGVVSDASKPDASVVEELDAGWQSAERVVRPAKVIVNRAGEGPER